jgi:hypothetical protein
MVFYALIFNCGVSFSFWRYDICLDETVVAELRLWWKKPEPRRDWRIGWLNHGSDARLTYRTKRNGKIDGWELRGPLVRYQW